MKEKVQSQGAFSARAHERSEVRTKIQVCELPFFEKFPNVIHQ